MRERKQWLTGLVQKLYITWSAFTANDLTTHATAGAYSFLLSALPLILMVLAILIRVIHASPEIILSFMSENAIFSRTLDPNAFLESIMSVRSVGLMEIVLGLSIFWMARRFFAEIQKGMTVIYRKSGKGKAIKENLIVIAAEVLLIFLIVVLATLMMSGTAIFDSLVRDSLIDRHVIRAVRALFRYAPITVIFLFLFLVYLFSPRTKPTVVQSFWAALACTLSFTLVRVVFAGLVNMTRYNLVYGILSNVIVLLLEVYLFFFLFLFFAQFQYVSQFFESFLLVKLYLLPKQDDPNPIARFERALFREPPFYRSKYEFLANKGDVLFRIGENSTDLYYIWEGFIRLEMPSQVIELGKGGMFGEFSSIIGGNRTATATATTDCVLLKIPASIFQATIEVDGEMSKRTLQMIADYMRANHHP